MAIFDPNEQTSVDVDLKSNPFDISGFIQARQGDLSKAQSGVESQIGRLRDEIDQLGNLTEEQVLAGREVSARRGLEANEAASIREGINQRETQLVQDLETGRARKEQLSREGFSRLGTGEKLGQEATERNIKREVERLALSTRTRDLQASQEITERLASALEDSIDQQFEQRKLRIGVEKDILSQMQKGADAAQKSVIDAQMKQLDVQIDEQNRLKNLKTSLATTILENGGSPQAAQMLAKAETEDEILEAAAKTGKMRDPLKALQMLKTQLDIDKARAVVGGVSKDDMKDIAKMDAYKSAKAKENLLADLRLYEDAVERLVSLPVSNKVAREQALTRVNAFQTKAKTSFAKAEGLGALADFENSMIDNMLKTPDLYAKEWPNLPSGIGGSPLGKVQSGVGALEESFSGSIGRDLETINMIYGDGIGQGMFPDSVQIINKMQSDDDLLNSMSQTQPSVENL